MEENDFRHLTVPINRKVCQLITVLQFYTYKISPPSTALPIAESVENPVVRLDAVTHSHCKLNAVDLVCQQHGRSSRAWFKLHITNAVFRQRISTHPRLSSSIGISVEKSNVSAVLPEELHVITARSEEGVSSGTVRRSRHNKSTHRVRQPTFNCDIWKSKVSIGIRESDSGNGAVAKFCSMAQCV